MEQNKVHTYILYAIGEIFLVVIGILIALQVNNWNEQRKERLTEQDYLYRLLEDMERDSTSLQGSIRLTGLKVDQAGRLIEQFASNKKLADTVNFVRDAFLVGRGGSFRPYLPAYEELISTGKLNIIQNEEITSRITRHIYRVEGWESFVYTEGETRRSEYMKHLHMYFSAMIMDYIWEVDNLDLKKLKNFGIQVEDYLRDPDSKYNVQNVAALNMELNRLYKQNMEVYIIPVLNDLRKEIEQLEN